MELSNAPFPPSPDVTVHGHVTFQWIEGGSLLVMRQSEQSGTTPSARWAIGRDESGSGYKVLYSDNRGVSRVFEMSLSEGLWQLWRNAPGFSQRFEGRVSPDRKTITSHWKKSFDSTTWEHDVDVTYTRLQHWDSQARLRVCDPAARINSQRLHHAQGDSHPINPIGSGVRAHGQSWSLGMPGLTRWRTNIPSTLNITENSLRAIRAL